MKRVWIVGNVLRDTYLALDSQDNQFETGANGEKWLDVGFAGQTYNFYRQTSVYGGAAITSEVMKNFGLAATVAHDWREDGGGDEGRNCRYLLCQDTGVAYLTPRERPTTVWATPSEVVDWVFVDRSATVTPDLAEQIRTFLAMASQTRLAVYLSKEAGAAAVELAALADLIFIEEGAAAPEVAPGAVVCRIGARYLECGETKVHWHSHLTDKMTHLTTYSVMAAVVFGALETERDVPEALDLGRISAETMKLGRVPSPEELLHTRDLEASERVNTSVMAAALVAEGKGILAADESGGSIHQHFAALDIDDTEQNRRDYRNLLLTTPDLGEYVNGVILFDETTRQAADDGRNFVEYLTDKGIIPGVKVDLGLADLPGSEEKYTLGLDGLGERLYDYYRTGLRFAKWRAAFTIAEGQPSETAVRKNCEILAEYARTCQDENIVPIVEPELVHAGNYSLEQCAQTTGWILDILFEELEKTGVQLDACILKVNMVLAGSEWHTPSTATEVGAATADTLREHVPAELAGVVFLSGGQGVEQATENLQAVINNGPFPWPVTFSFARALQGPALESWRGDNEKVTEVQAALTERLAANAEALTPEGKRIAVE